VLLAILIEIDEDIGVFAFSDRFAALFPSF